MVYKYMQLQCPRGRKEDVYNCKNIRTRFETGTVCRKQRKKELIAIVQFKTYTNCDKQIGRSSVQRNEVVQHTEDVMGKKTNYVHRSPLRLQPSCPNPKWLASHLSQRWPVMPGWHSHCPVCMSQ